MTTGVAILRLSGTRSSTHETDGLPPGVGVDPPQIRQSSRQGVPTHPGRGNAFLWDQLFALNHPRQQPVRARPDPGSWNVRLGPSQLNTGLERKQRGWLFRKHFRGGGGDPDLQTVAPCIPEVTGYRQTDTHQSQELHCKLGLRSRSGGTSDKVTWNPGEGKVLPEARMMGGAVCWL